MIDIKTHFNIITSKPLYYIYSFPKSGRTWLRFIIAHYLNLKYELNLDIDLHSIFKLLPNDGFGRLKGINSYSFAENKQFPLIIFSHSPYKYIKFQNKGIIFLLRSIFDVTASYYFHMSKLLNRYQKGIKSFIRDSNHGLIQYINYINTWAPVLSKRSDKLILTYESLHQNTVDTTAYILSYAGIFPDQTFLKKAIQLSSFQNMQKIEKKRGIAGHKYNYSDIEARRIRKGIIGGYSDYFDAEDIDHIKKQCDLLLTNEAKHLLYINQVEPYSDRHDTIEILK